MHRLLLVFWLSCIGLLGADTVFENNIPAAPASVGEGNRTDAEIPREQQSAFTMHVTSENRNVYTTIVRKPERLFRGEIFSVTLRSIVTTEAYQTLQYRFSGGEGLQLLGSEPEREYRDHAYFDRFYFKVTGSRVVLPDVTPYLTLGLSYAVDSEPVKGSAVDVTVLNPPDDFCGILAERFVITHTKTTVYDDDHNIIVFMAEANRSDLGDFSLKTALQQNFESLHNDPRGSSMTYYAVLPDALETLRFEYFDLGTQRYERIRIPIEVDEDLVSTVSDLKPLEHGHDYQKTVFFAVTAGLFFLLALWKRSWLLLLIALAAGGYAAWLSIPLRKVCINEGAPIYLLPMRNATVFEVTTRRYELEMQGHIEDYTKVRLLNNKIGWVRDEDICTY